MPGAGMDNRVLCTTLNAQATPYSEGEVRIDSLSDHAPIAMATPQPSSAASEHGEPGPVSS